MPCLSCNKNNNLITYNNLHFCSSCFEILQRKHESYEKKHKIKYEKPIKILDYLYIGSLASVSDLEEIKKIGISKIIIAGNNLNKIKNNSDFTYLELFLDDSLEQNLTTCSKLANNFINNNKEKNKILVHCYSGISRSSSIIIGYLIKELKMNYDEAFNFMKNKSSKICPNSNFEKQLRTF